MRLSEWNEVLDEARKQAHDCERWLQACVESKEYSMYDGRRGIKFVIYDRSGNPYNELMSGIKDTKEEYIRELKHMNEYILKNW